MTEFRADTPPAAAASTPSAGATGRLTWRRLDPGRALLTGLVLAYLSLTLAVESLDQASYLLILLFGAGVLALKYRELSPNLLEKGVIIALLLFFGANLLAYLAGPINYDGFKTLGKLVRLPLAIIPLLVLRRADLRSVAWLGCTLGALLAFAVAVEDVVLHQAARASGHTNPILFGNIGLMLGFLSVALAPAACGPRRSRLLLSTTALAAGVGVSLLSGTRGGWIAMPCMLAVLLFAHRQHLTRRRLIGVAILLAALAAGAASWDRANPVDRLRTTIEHVTAYFSDDPARRDRATSVGIRLALWEASWNGFLERPLLGVGWGAMEHFFEARAESRQRYRHIGKFGHAHSQYLSTLLCAGLIGTAALLYLLLACARLFWAHRHCADPRTRSVSTAGLVLVTGFAVFALTEAILLRAMPVTFFALMLALLGSQLRLAPAAN